MTDSPKVFVHATTIQNQSKTSIQFELTKEMLGQVLDWNPDGAGVEEINALLQDRVGVEVFTDKTYRLVPFTGELAEGDVPSVESVVVRRLGETSQGHP